MAKKSKKEVTPEQSSAEEEEEVQSDLPSEVSDENGALGYDMEEGEMDIDDEMVASVEGDESGEMEQFDGGSEEAIEAAQ